MATGGRILATFLSDDCLYILLLISIWLFSLYQSWTEVWEKLFVFSPLLFVLCPFSLCFACLCFIACRFFLPSGHFRSLDALGTGHGMTIDSAQLSLINAHYMLYLILAITLKILNLGEKIGKRRKRNKVKLTKMLRCVSPTCRKTQHQLQLGKAYWCLWFTALHS